MRSASAWLASEDVAVQTEFLADLSDNALLALPYLFEFWAHDHQIPPEGDWKTWLVLGGRGAGKTRAGSEWVRSMVEGDSPQDPGRCSNLALVGQTYDQVRDIMIFGDSGILACTPPDRLPVWKESQRTLVWPNGARAQAFSASDPEALRGPQFDGAWVDELAKWKEPEKCWDMLQFALRLGEAPQQCVTTTPRPIDLLRVLLERDNTVITQAPTEANSAFLAESFIQEVRNRYAGTRLGRQELDGVFEQNLEGALWSHEMVARARTKEPLEGFDRIVIAVDPPVTGHSGSDECGIIVAGSSRDEKGGGLGEVLADCSVSAASPQTWARAVAQAYEAHGADCVIAEVNQGGDLVETVLRQHAPSVVYKKVHARLSKVARAQPVALLYEQNRIGHRKGLDALESQMRNMTFEGFQSKGSPDRLDAMVWAITHLLVKSVAPSKPALRAL
ncbi:MAG: terminase family protein [Pseudomonadota bacterium]